MCPRSVIGFTQKEMADDGDIRVRGQGKNEQEKGGNRWAHRHGQLIVALVSQNLLPVVVWLGASNY